MSADTAEQAGPVISIGSAKVFGHLPEGIFKPLVGKYRHVYVEILRRLHDGLFSVDTVGSPLRDEVAAEIGFILARHADVLEGHGLTSLIAYNELRETGWIQEERVNWQVYVTMDPAVSHALHALCTLGEQLGESFGEGTVGVLNHLKGAIDAPETGALGIAEARKRAVQSARSMRAVAANLRRIEGDLLRSASRDSLVDRFFQDFVERIHIGDYALLASRNNPYQFRHRILGIAAEIRTEPEQLRQLAAALLAQARCRSLAEAEACIDADLAEIVLAFEAIERAREQIDQTKVNIERRFVNSMRYMDLAGSDRSARMAAALGRVGDRLLPVETSDQQILEVAVGLRQRLSSIHESGAADPVAEREAVRPRRQRAPKPDPVIAAYERAKAEFDTRMQTTPERVSSFARRLRRPSGTAAEYPVESLEDALLFSALLSQASQSGFRLPGLRVTPRPGRVANDWIEVTDFMVEEAEDA